MVVPHGAKSMGLGAQADLGLCLGPTHCQAALNKMLNVFELQFPHRNWEQF